MYSTRFAIGLVAVMLTLFVAAVPPASAQFDPTETIEECIDGQDNDGDGTIDDEDATCEFSNVEQALGSECEDLEDNDGDGDIDGEDFGCTDDDEALETPPSLTRFNAHRYLRTALRAEFGRQWTTAEQTALHCTRRLSRLRFSCNPAWVSRSRRFVYDGLAQIWLRAEGEEVTWNYSWRIYRIDLRCLRVRGAQSPRCVRTYRVT